MLQELLSIYASAKTIALATKGRLYLNDKTKDIVKKCLDSLDTVITREFVNNLFSGNPRKTRDIAVSIIVGSTLKVKGQCDIETAERMVKLWDSYVEQGNSYIEEALANIDYKKTVEDSIPFGMSFNEILEEVSIAEDRMARFLFALWINGGLHSGR